MNQMLLFANGIVDKIIKGIFKPLVQGLFTLSFSFITESVKYAGDSLEMTPVEYAASPNFQTFGKVLYNGNGTGMIDKIIENVIMPVATVILVYVILYEFISALLERNSFHEFDTAIFIRFIFKTTLGIFLLTHALDVVNAFFDLGKFIISGVSDDSNPIGTLTQAQAGLNSYLDQDSTSGGEIVGLLIPALIFFLVTVVMFVGVYVCLFGRMMEIFMHISIAPIPMATITNRELGESGKNYIKLIFSFILQAFFIMLAIVIFSFLCSSLGDLGNNYEKTNVALHIMEISALGIVLILAMFKSGNLAKSILNCH